MAYNPFILKQPKKVDRYNQRSNTPVDYKQKAAEKRANYTQPTNERPKLPSILDTEEKKPYVYEEEKKKSPLDLGGFRLNHAYAENQKAIKQRENFYKLGENANTSSSANALGITDEMRKSASEKKKENNGGKFYTSDKDLINDYESIKNTNVFSRLLSSKAKDDYDRKQALEPQYREAKNRETDINLKKVGSSLEAIKESKRRSYDKSFENGVLSGNYNEDIVTKDEHHKSALDALQRAGYSFEEAQRIYNNIDIDDYVTQRDVEEYGKLGATLNSIPMNTLQSTAGTIGNAVKYVAGVPLSENADYANKVRSNVTKDMGTVGQTLYGTATSIGDMLFNAAIAGGNANLLMGAEKANATMNEAVKRGLNPSQVIGEGIASGVTTAITEKIPLGNFEKLLKNGVGETGVKAIAKTLVSSAIPEGLQEMSEDVADAVADRIIAGNKSELNMQIADLERNGATHDDAVKQTMLGWLGQTALDGIAGALSGAVMGGGANIVNAIGNRANVNTPTNENASIVENMLAEDNAEENRLASIERENRFAEEQTANAPTDLTALMEQFRAENPNANTENNLSDNELMDMITNPTELPANLPDTATENEVPSILPQTETNPVETANNDTMPDLETMLANGQIDEGTYLVLRNALEEEQAQNVPNNVAETPDEEILAQLTEQPAITPTENSVPSMRNEVMAEDIGLNDNINEEFNFEEETPEETQPESTPIPTVRETKNGDKLTIDATDIPKISQTSWNTFENSNIFKQSEERTKWLKTEQDEGNHSVDTVSEHESVQKAKDRLNKDYQGEYDRIMYTTEISGVEQDESMMIIDNLLTDAIDNGNTERLSELSKFVQNFIQKTHKAAQGLQALAKYSRTAAGAIAQTEKMVETAVDGVARKNGERVKENAKLAKALRDMGGYDARAQLPAEPVTLEQIRQEVANTLDLEVSSINERFSDTDIEYLANQINQGVSANELTKMLNRHMVTGSFGMTAEDLKAVVDLYNEANTYGRNSRKADETMQKANAILANYLPASTFMEKWNAWRYLSMLGNPRTHIRNILGNAMFGTVTNIKDDLGALMEAGYAKASGNNFERSKSILTREDKALRKASANDFEENAYAVATDGDKYNLKNDIAKQKRIFKGKTNDLYEANSTALDSEDTFAIKNKYTRALAGYLKANGKNESIFTSENKDDIRLLQRARDYAVKQAKIATFHEDNAVAKVLTQWSKTAKAEGSFGTKALDIALEAVVPFKKTPANILKQGAIEYNPAVQIPKALMQTKNGANPTEIIDSYAKGMTGGMILALGGWLASKGILRAKNEEDTDELLDEQEYSINFGNHSYTIDWAAPAALPLFVGAELYNTWKGEKGFFDALTSVSEPVIEMSMLSGLRDTLNNIAYSINDKEKNTFSTLGINLATGYASQGIPTALGQVARAVDDTRRDTYTGKGGDADTIERAGRKALNKLPGLSMLNQPYVNEFGNTEENTGGNFFGRLAYNMLSPGYYANTERNETEAEIERLMSLKNGENGEDFANVVPDRAAKSYNKQKLTPEQYTKLQQSTQIEEMLETLINSDKYKALSDVEKSNTMATVEKFAGALAKHKALGYDIGSSSTYKKAYEAYENGNIEGLIDEITKTSTFNDLDITANDVTKELYANDDMEGLKKYSEALDVAREYDLEKITSDEWEMFNSGNEEQFRKELQISKDITDNNLPEWKLIREKMQDTDANKVTADYKKARDIVTRYGNGEEFSNSDLTKFYDLGETEFRKYEQAKKIAKQYGFDSITEDEYKTFSKKSEAEFRDKLNTKRAFGDYDFGSNEFTKQYLKENGEGALPRLNEAYKVISSIQTGVDDYGDAKYLPLNEKTYSVYETYGEKGLNNYVTLSNTDRNNDGNVKLEDDRLPTLKSLGLSAEESGYMLSQFVSGKKVDDYIANKDYAGLYKYYLDKYGIR